MQKKYLMPFLLFSFFTNSLFSQWNTICSSGNGFVVDFQVYNNKLLATGFANSMAGQSCNYMMQWDGSAWQSTLASLSEAGHDLNIGSNGQLIVTRYEAQQDSNWVYGGTELLLSKLYEGVYLSSYVAGGSKTPTIYKTISYNGQLVAAVNLIKWEQKIFQAL
jgi:hypothetical protein